MMANPSSQDDLEQIRLHVQQLQQELESLRERLEHLVAVGESMGSTPSPAPTIPEPVEPGKFEWAEPVAPPPPATRPPTTAWEDEPTTVELREGGVEGPREVAQPIASEGEGPAEETFARTGGAELVIGGTWLNRIGAVILLLAAAFFVKYSFDQGWISPTLRVILGAVAGLALVGVGEACLFRKMRTFAGGLLGCGVGVLYLSTFGAYNFYGLIGSQTAAILYVCVTVLSVIISVHGRMLPVAILAVIGGYGTPIALSTGANQQVSLLLYVLFLDIGFLASAFIRRWDVLRLLAWIGTAALFGAWYAEFYDSTAMWRTWAFLAAFYVVFHGEAILCLRLQAFSWARAVSSVIHADNVVFFAGTYFLLRGSVPQWMGLFAVVLAGVQWLAAWRVVPREDTTVSPRLALWLNGAAMLALAAPLQFDRYLVSISWATQAVVTLWFCRRFASAWLRVKGLGVLAAGVVHLAVYDYHAPELTHIVWEIGPWTFTWVVALFAFAGLCSYVGGVSLAIRRAPDGVDRRLCALLLVFGSGLLLWLFADQWERYLATWWWLGLTAVWWVVAWRAGAATPLAFALVLFTCVKYLLWDTGNAARGAWSEIDGIVFNRAVVTGVLLVGLAVAVRPLVDRMPHSYKEWMDLPEPKNILAFVAALVVTWTGTFEIARIFHFEQWAQTHFEHPLHARGMFITAFWALQAAVMWGLAGPGRRTVCQYTLALTWIVIFKLVCADTFFFAASGRWAELSSICANRVFLAGLFVIATVLWSYWRARRVVGAERFWLFEPLTLTALLIAATVLVTWVPTFEIARVFRFEPFRLRFEDPQLAMHVALSIFWSVNATACLALGFARRIAVLRHLALGLFCVTIIKLFIFDLSHLETIYRIISFLVLGVLLLFASLLYQRLSSRIEEKVSG